MRISGSLFKCNYLKNTSLLRSFLFHLWNLNQILNIFKKKKIVIANVFQYIQTVKYSVGPLSRKRRFRTSFDSQHVKGSQTLVKSAWKDFYHIFSSIWEEFIWKISPLLKFEIIGVFVNTSRVDYNYPVRDCGICRSLFKYKYPQNKNFFLSFFVPFMESTSNFKYFWKKEDRDS